MTNIWKARAHRMEAGIKAIEAYCDNYNAVLDSEPLRTVQMLAESILYGVTPILLPNEAAKQGTTDANRQRTECLAPSDLAP